MRKRVEVAANRGTRDLGYQLMLQVKLQAEVEVELGVEVEDLRCRFMFQPIPITP